MRIMKYKVVEEYDRFYLAISPSGWKETFNKSEYKPNSDGYIIKKRENNYQGNSTAYPPINTPWVKEKIVGEKINV